MATQNDVAVHLDLSQQAVSKLKNAGTLTTGPGRSGYDLDDCRVAYIRHLRNSAAGRDSTRIGSLEAERARLAAAQAEAAERKNARDRRELVPLLDVTNAVTGLIEVVKGRLMQVPARVAKGDIGLRGRIESAVVDALEELSMTRVEEVTGSDLTDEDEDDDAGGVGDE